MSDLTLSESWARSLPEREADAALVRLRCGSSPDIALTPLDLEKHFPVACVAVPDLCIGVACRWAMRGAGTLPPCLQVLMEGDSLEMGRPLRGACLAFRGKALLLADEKDDRDEQRFSFLHEAAHFFLHHAFPREDTLRRMGEGIRPVLDSRRPPHLGERFDAAVRRADLQFHTHLYQRHAPGRSDAESDADVLACLLLAPCLSGAPAPSPLELSANFGLPEAIAERYAAALAHRLASPARPRNPLLARLGIGR